MAKTNSEVLDSLYLARDAVLTAMETGPSARELTIRGRTVLYDSLPGELANILQLIKQFENVVSTSAGGRARNTVRTGRI